MGAEGRRNLTCQSSEGRASQADKQPEQRPESWKKHCLGTEVPSDPVEKGVGI